MAWILITKELTFQKIWENTRGDFRSFRVL